MDFSGLARRQLQALCKLNKIPANIKNVAMVDALSALDHVEGLDEIMQQQTQESIDSMTPATGNRTSTRVRKPPVGVLESSGKVSRSRARTGKLVNEDSVEGEKKDVANTPAVVSRKRAPAASSRRKAVEPSVQRVYSTRRSVRLLEKQLSELSLGESVKEIQAIMIDDELSSGTINTVHKAEEEAKIDEPEKCAEKVAVTEVHFCQVSCQTVETVQIIGTSLGDQFSDNGEEEIITTEEVENSAEEAKIDEPEKCAEKVADLEVNFCQVSSQTVEAVGILGSSLGGQFSDSGKEEIVATEEVEKPMTENPAEEVEGDEENANAGIGSTIIADVSYLGDVDAKSATPEKLVEQKPHNIDVFESETVCVDVHISLVKEEVDLKPSHGEGIEFNKLAEQEPQDMVFVQSKTVLSEVRLGSLVKEEVYLKSSNDNGNELEKLVDQELQALEVVEPENISTTVPYSLDEDDVDLKSSTDQFNEVERLSVQELQRTEVFHSKTVTVKDVVPHSLVEENLDLESAADLDNVVDKLVEQELQEVEVILPETVSAVVHDSLVKEEVHSATEQGNEVVKDCKYDTVADQSFNATVDVEQSANEVAMIESQADNRDADLSSSTEEESCITGDDYRLEDAFTEIVSSPLKEVKFIDGLSQATEPAATKEVHGTTCQVDGYDLDADSMIRQMSSPHQLSDHIEDKTDESNSLDTDSLVHALSQERIICTPNRWLAADPALCASPHSKVHITVQRNLIKRSPLATTEDVNKENIVSGLQTEVKNEAPTTPLERMSNRKLYKLLKERVTSAQETEEDASKHIKQNQPVKHRPALQTLFDNTLV